MMFINTRPASRAKTLTNFLQKQGITVLELPLLALVACELSEQEIHFLKRLNTPDCYTALVFISETAVSYFFECVENHQIRLNPNLPIVAVGQSTAHVFTQFWQKFYPSLPEIITPSQFNLPENNEGLLQIPFIQHLKNSDNVLILKGKDGRALLKNTLRQKGVIVDEVDFYQRVFPPTSKQIFQNFYQEFWQHQKIFPTPIVLITSLTAWQHWQNLAQAHCNPSVFSYLVLQQRIAEGMLASLPQTTPLQVVADLQPITIFQAMQRFKESS